MKALQLEVGSRYRIAANCASGFDQFDEGQILTFTKSAYSPYDDCYFYEFLEDSGKSKSWVVPYDLVESVDIPFVLASAVPPPISPGKSGRKEP